MEQSMQQPLLMPTETQLDNVAPEKHFTIFATWCVGLNGVIGVGILTMPWTFVQGGLLLAPLFLLLFTFSSWLNGMWIPEASARASYVVEAQGGAPAGTLDSQIHSQTAQSTQELRTQTTQLDRDDAQMGTLASERLGPPEALLVREKFEMNELCRVFLGKRVQRVYEVCVAFYMLGVLWAAAAVFASSLATQIAIPFVNDGHTCDVYKDHSSSCSLLYLFWLALFSVVVVPLTCMDLTEQKPVQIFLSLGRFVIIALIMFAAVLAIFAYPDQAGPIPHPHKGPPYISDAPLLKWSGLPKVLSVVLYAPAFQTSIPCLMAPLDPKMRSKLPWILLLILVTMTACYIGVGMPVALYYGSETDSLCTLNFKDFRGGAALGATIPVWARVVTFLIILFPAVDMLSAYPLNGLVTANILCGSLASYLADTRTDEQTMLIPESDNTSDKRSKDDTLPAALDWRVVIAVRLGVAVLPLVGGACVKSLDVILGWTGALSVFVSYVLPAWLQLASIKRLRQMRGEKGELTECRTRFSHPKWAWLLLAFNLCVLVFAFASKFVV